MRIIAGKFRGRRLKSSLSRKSLKIRPTSDRVREAIFNMLQSEIEGTRVCDLFAGTGAMGIEALSRGCSFCTFVESNKIMAARILENLRMLSVSNKNYEIAAMPVERFFRIPKENYNFIFLDPPYEKNLVEPALISIIQKKLLAPSGRIVVEEKTIKNGHLNRIQELEVLKEKTYGDTQIRIYKMKKS